MIGGILAIDTSCPIKLMYLKLLEDLDRVGDYAWVQLHLQYSIGIFVGDHNKGLKLSVAFLPLLQVWIYERILPFRSRREVQLDAQVGSLLDSLDHLEPLFGRLHFITTQKRHTFFICFVINWIYSRTTSDMGDSGMRYLPHTPYQSLLRMDSDIQHASVAPDNVKERQHPTDSVPFFLDDDGDLTPHSLATCGVG